MNRFEAQGLSGNFEFEADIHEFDGAEFEGAQFGEAGFGEAEFDGGEFEGEWDGEVARPSPAAFAAGGRACSRLSSAGGFAPRLQAKPMVVVAIALLLRRRLDGDADQLWVTSRVPFVVQPLVRPVLVNRPLGQRYRWGQPGLSSQWYRGGQYPGRYWRFGQQPFGMTPQGFPGGTPQWGWDRWGRRRRRYPYGRYGLADRPSRSLPTTSRVEPPYEEPPMPPPVIVAAPPPPPPAPMAEPPPESPMAEPPPQPRRRRRKARQQPKNSSSNPRRSSSNRHSPGYEGESFESGFGEFESGAEARCPTRRSTRTR